MAFITLTTDWNKIDYYAGAVKGTIISICSDAKIIDISHQITRYSINEAAFVLQNSYHYFPKGTIHVVDVYSFETASAPYIAVEHNGHFFVGADNGIFNLICQYKPQNIVQLRNEQNESFSSFAALTFFAPAAAHLANGKSITQLGESLTNIDRRSPLMATYDDDYILGTVVYIDSYKNCITDISKELFEKVGKGRSFEITFKTNRNKIDCISNNYNDVTAGMLLALFNSANLLELAVNKGDMGDLFAMELKTNVRITFK